MVKSSPYPQPFPHDLKASRRERELEAPLYDPFLVMGQGFGVGLAV